LRCSLQDLEATLSANRIAGEAMLFIRWPREAQQAHMPMAQSAVGRVVSMVQD